ncbi:MAG: hypothetical protein HRU41_23455 [Saprospiraceae bacterium]|nr:hypothetical protein [Saprospiraceae bacterium]
MLRKFKVLIDYRAAHILLEKQAKNSSYSIKHLDPPHLSYSFRYKGDTPMIEANLGGYDLKLAIDTGAEINLFDQKLYASYQTFLQVGDRRKLSSFSKRTQNHRSSKMRKLSVDASPLAPMNTLFVSLSDWNTSTAGPRTDAILGFEFLVQFQIEINYRTKELKLWYQHDPKATVGTSTPRTGRSK